MSNLTRAMMMGAAGASGDKTYVDDVFSTYLFLGSSSPVTITNGLDLSGEGGLIWIKSRTSTASHSTSSSANNYYGIMTPNTTAADADSTTQYVKGTSTGFQVTMGNITPNDAGEDMASWSFRKAPGFFDVVTYTGTGSAQNISHSLGSVPGMIIIKCTTNGYTDWLVYHRSLGATKAITLNSTAAVVTSGAAHWNDTAPTSSVFTVNTAGNVNLNGGTHVAYIFAHDEASFGTDGDESIIKCGTYAGNGTSGQIINLGFEAQWLMIKSYTRGGGGYGWTMVDMMRDRTLFAEETGNSGGGQVTPSANGFHLLVGDSNVNESGESYIYMAIRRPNKPPSAATEVFDDVTYNGTGSAVSIANSLSYTDLVWLKRRTSTDRYALTDRIRGGTKYLSSDRNDSENTWSGEALELDQMDSFGIAGHSSGINNSSGQPYISWNFKRATGFFDIVAYDGNNLATNQNHNLGVPPELIITKLRAHASNKRDWAVGPFVSGLTNYLILNETNTGGTLSGYFPGTPTSTTWALPGGGSTGVNGTGYAYISYLFATLPGISKVGSYSGTGNAINVDCGFSSGARFILIKRTDASGDWYVYDTARGIVSGNDPYLFPNTTAAEVTNTDYIDPLSSGFTVTSSAPAALNTNGGTYLFLAIA